MDHFITSKSEKIKLNNELPCCEISDHDGPYIGINARIECYQPQFKYIRDNSKLIKILKQIFKNYNSVLYIPWRIQKIS